jgi:hypothetical protein
MARFIGPALALLVAVVGLDATFEPAAAHHVRLPIAGNFRAGVVTHESIEVRWDIAGYDHPAQMVGDMYVRVNTDAPGGYRVWRSLDTTFRATFDRLTPSRAYRFSIEYCASFRHVAPNEPGATCSSEQKLTVTTLPSPVSTPPSNLRAGIRTGHSIQVRWTDTTAGETRFELQWGEEGATAWQTRTVGANVTSTSISGLVELTAYDFRVRACAGSVCSQWTPTVTAQTQILRCGEFIC